MISKIEPPVIYVADTGTRRGRGVFAARSFVAGEVVEVAPVVIVPEVEVKTRLPANVKVTIHYVREVEVLVFDWSYLANVPKTSALALGYGSLYNSANPANMRYEAVAAESVLRFVAVRNIGAHEELTINYDAVGGGAEWKDRNWFTRMKVTPIE